MSQRFLSVDWGTSSLRVQGVSYPRGILQTYEAWKASGRDRVAFYLSVLQELAPFEGPCVISGMASSNMGMKELPYATLPFGLDGSGLVTELIGGRVLLVSGVRSETDVMRGEETQLIGSADGDGCYIFPGTHSKHIVVREGKAVGFKTYMTGEFFSLLVRHSLLSWSVEPGSDLPAFREGVLARDLLHDAFRVRANDLFGSHSKSENFAFLSGLCIGAELREVGGRVVVVGDPEQRERYGEALRVLGMSGVGFVDSAAAVVRGHEILAGSRGLHPGWTLV